MTLRQLLSTLGLALACLGIWSPAVLSAPASAPAKAPAQVLADDPAARDALLEVAGTGFQIKQTPHFLICYNTDRATVDRLTGRLEQTWTNVLRFCEQVGFDLKPLPERLEVIFFDQPRDYLAYVSKLGYPGQGTYGAYFEDNNRAAFFNVENDPQIGQIRAAIDNAKERLAKLDAALKAAKSIDRVVVRFGDGQQKPFTRSEARQEIQKSQRELTSLGRQRESFSDKTNRMIIQHETAHQVLFNAGGHTRGATNPKWLVEGLACMFETPPSSGGAGLTATNHARLGDLRAMMTAPGSTLPSAAGLLDAIKSRRVVGLRELVTRPELLQQRGEQGAKAYALAWGLTHYLQRARNKELGAYLREVSDRKPNVEVTAAEELRVFEKHFGPVDEGLTQRFGDYIVKLPYRDPTSLR